MSKSIKKQSFGESNWVEKTNYKEEEEGDEKGRKEMWMNETASFEWRKREMREE